MKDFSFNNHDYKVFCMADVKEAKAVIQIIHGAHEYIERYRQFAEAMNQKGFICIGIDHLGHGTNATDTDGVVTFAENDGRKIVLEAQKALLSKIKEEYDLPVVVLGHSMGSFIFRSILPDISNDIDAAIISGTTHSSKAEYFGANTLASTIKLFKGSSYSSNFLNFITFDSLADKMLKKGEIEHTYEWLTTDESLYSSIKADKYLHKSFSISANLDIFSWLKMISSKEHFQSGNKDLPIYIMSGERDPLNYGKVKKVYQMYLDGGYKDVLLKEYPDGRHEMLNEINRLQVFDDIAQFISNKI